jgi:outer membrane immunogenic protein
MVAGAAAADLPVYTKAPAPPPMWSWTGWYLGLNAGGAWTRSNVAYTQTGAYPGFNAPADVAFANALGSPTLNQGGFTGGGQAGYNYQAGWAVWGLETDINYLHTSAGNFAAGTLPVAAAGVTSTVNVTTDWLYTLRGRLGVSADRALYYVTGGLAVGNESFSQNFFHTATGSAEAGSTSATKAGWTVGGGVEYAFTNRVSAKVEYLYVDLGSVSFNSVNTVFPTFTAANSANLKESIVRGGINFRY